MSASHSSLSSPTPSKCSQSAFSCGWCHFRPVSGLFSDFFQIVRRSFVADSSEFTAATWRILPDTTRTLLNGFSCCLSRLPPHTQYSTCKTLELIYLRFTHICSWGIIFQDFRSFGLATWCFFPGKRCRLSFCCCGGSLPGWR